MTMNKEENMDEMTMNVTERLPDLDEEDTSTALQNVNWAAGFVRTPPGAIYNDRYGVALQVVATRTVR